MRLRSLVSERNLTHVPLLLETDERLNPWNDTKSAASVPTGQRMADLSVLKEKKPSKPPKQAVKRAKIGHFPYIKQNSIAEIVSTMESFLPKSDQKVRKVG